LIPDPSYDEIYKLTKGHKITLTADASPRQRGTFKKLIDLSDEEIEDFNSLPQDGATYDQFLDLIGHILILDPDKRYTATEILDHPFFNPYREIIVWCRKSYPPISTMPDNINVICCRERAWACKVAFLIFNGRGYLTWYTHNILFQSIDMFDRYLSYIDSTTTSRLTESKTQGKYLTRYHTELHYIVCLYMCIKYFTTLHIPISFTELATDDYKTDRAMLEAEQFEQKMLKEVLQLKVYRSTVYDIACNINGSPLDEHQTCDLLDRYGNIRNHYKNVAPNDLYNGLIQSERK
jgi:serine/threonine protein kinase